MEPSARPSSRLAPTRRAVASASSATCRLFAVARRTPRSSAYPARTLARSADGGSAGTSRTASS